MNLRYKTGEERRLQTLSDKRDNNQFCLKPNYLKPHPPLNRSFCKTPENISFSEDHDRTCKYWPCHVCRTQSFCLPPLLPSFAFLLRKLAIIGEALRACETRSRGAPLLRKFGNLSIRETRTLTCKHKIWGEKLVLKTCRVYL